MPDITEALTRFLLKQGSLAAAGSRIYQDDLPQGCELPAILVREVDGVPGHHQLAADGLVTGRIQVDAWTRNKTAAIALREALRVLLDGKAACDLGADGETIAIAGIHMENRYLTPHAPADGDSAAEYQGTVDLTIWYRE